MPTAGEALDQHSPAEIDQIERAGPVDRLRRFEQDPMQCPGVAVLGPERRGSGFSGDRPATKPELGERALDRAIGGAVAGGDWNLHHRRIARQSSCAETERPEQFDRGLIARGRKDDAWY